MGAEGSPGIAAADPCLGVSAHYGWADLSEPILDALRAQGKGAAVDLP